MTAPVGSDESIIAFLVARSLLAWAAPVMRIPCGGITR